MTQIAMKFVQWDVPELDGLKDSKVYRLRERLNNGDKLTREEKNCGLPETCGSVVVSGGGLPWAATFSIFRTC